MWPGGVTIELNPSLHGVTSYSAFEECGHTFISHTVPAWSSFPKQRAYHTSRWHLLS